jgi:hypothetical protein
MIRPALLLIPAALFAETAIGSARPEHHGRFSPTEQRVLLGMYDANKDGSLSEAELAKVLDEHGDQVKERIKDPERRAKLEGEHGKRLLLRLIAGDLTNKAWFKALTDKTHREARSPQDLIEVVTTHALPKGDAHRAFIKVRWGDLDNLIAGGGKQHYANWDGTLTIHHGTAQVVKKVAFDDAKGKEPKEGSGADQLDDAGGDQTVRWRAATVGWTDGLIIQLDLPHPASNGTVVAGGKTIHFTITPAPANIALPDGRTTPPDSGSGGFVTPR